MDKQNIQNITRPGIHLFIYLDKQVNQEKLSSHYSEMHKDILEC